jgi:hypothetical protein
MCPTNPYLTHNKLTDSVVDAIPHWSFTIAKLINQTLGCPTSTGLHYLAGWGPWDLQ